MLKSKKRDNTKAIPPTAINTKSVRVASNFTLELTWEVVVIMHTAVETIVNSICKWMVDA